MKATIKLLTFRKEKPEGFPICVELFLSAKKRPRKTIGYSKMEFWDTENSHPLKAHPHYFYLLPTVLEYKAKAAKINFGNYTFDEAKGILFDDAENQHPKETKLLSFFDTIINEKKAKQESYKKYADVRSVFNTYLEEVDMPINHITYEWLNSFVLNKLQTGCNQGGVMAYLSTLKALYKEAQRRSSLKIKIDNPFLGIIKSTTTKAVISLSNTDFKKLYTFKPHQSTTTTSVFNMQRAINLWLFQYYIGGHDFVDVALLKWTDIKKNRLQFKRHKLRNKKNGGPSISNMLCEEAFKSIETYGNPDTERIFNHIPHPEHDRETYRNYRNNVNRTLASITKTLKLTETLKSKSPRYVFRTYAGELLIHDLVVMKLQGHTPSGVTFNYQGTISHQVIDEMHQKLIDYVKG